MRAKIVVVVFIAGVVVAASVGSAWRDARAIRAADFAVATVTQHRAEAVAELRRIEARLAEAEKTRVRLQAESEASSKAASAKTRIPASAKSTPSATEEELGTFIQKQREAEKNPQVQLLLLATRRAKSAATFGLLFRTLGLSPAQIEKFKDNVVRREEQQMDLLAVMRELGLTLRDPAPAKLWVKIEPAYQAAQKELLGEPGYRQLQDYARAAEARNAVSRLAGAATVTGVPFTTQQAEQLVRMVANASSDYRGGGNAFLFAVDWAMVDEEAETILSEAQMNLFKTIEPPGEGGRHWGQVNRLLMQAEKADTEIAKRTPSPKPGG